MSLERIIPYNHADGTAVGGIMVKTRNLIEAVCFSLIPLYIIFKFATQLTITRKISLSILIVAPIAAICIIGINGDCVTVFFKTWFQYRRKRRILFYNPRIKTEAVPLIFEKDANTQRTAKKYLDEVISKIKAQQKAKRYAKLRQTLVVETQDGPVFFEDDIGVLATPEEYKTEKEKKEDRKREKQAIRKAKKAEKLSQSKKKRMKNRGEGEDKVDS